MYKGLADKKIKRFVYIMIDQKQEQEISRYKSRLKVWTRQIKSLMNKSKGTASKLLFGEAGESFLIFQVGVEAELDDILYRININKKNNIFWKILYIFIFVNTHQTIIRHAKSREPGNLT